MTWLDSPFYVKLTLLLMFFIIKMIVAYSVHCNVHKSFITWLYFPTGSTGDRGHIFNGICAKLNYIAISEHSLMQKVGVSEFLLKRQHVRRTQMWGLKLADRGAS